MNNNLEVWTAAKEVSSLLGRVITSYRATQKLNRGEMIALEESIRSFQYKIRAYNCAELTKVHIMLISEIQELIDHKNLQGDCIG